MPFTTIAVSKETRDLIARIKLDTKSKTYDDVIMGLVDRKPAIVDAFKKFMGLKP